jgi:PBP1b-binding outer membrane lipoprotein LpoB
MWNINLITKIFKVICLLGLIILFCNNCESECEEAPVKDVHKMTDEEIKEIVF